MPLTDTTYPLAGIHAERIIGVIETRRDSVGSYDGGVVAYLDPLSTRQAGRECYTVHYYSVHENGDVSLSNGDYRLTREQAMKRLLVRAEMQGEGMWHPCLG